MMNEKIEGLEHDPYRRKFLKTGFLFVSGLAFSQIAKGEALAFHRVPDARTPLRAPPDRSHAAWASAGSNSRQSDSMAEMSQ